jgi:hypothetical protein
MEADVQSKLVIKVWSRDIAKTLPDGPVIVTVNPGSLLASKMVKWSLILQLVQISLCETALFPAFAGASGRYFDNDAAHFHRRMPPLWMPITPRRSCRK